MKPIRLIFASAGLAAALSPPAQAVEFATDIRPMLEKELGPLKDIGAPLSQAAE